MNRWISLTILLIFCSACAGHRLHRQPDSWGESSCFQMSQGIVTKEVIDRSYSRHLSYLDHEKFGPLIESIPLEKDRVASLEILIELERRYPNDSPNRIIERFQELFRSCS